MKRCRLGQSVRRAIRVVRGQPRKLPGREGFALRALPRWLSGAGPGLSRGGCALQCARGIVARALQPALPRLRVERLLGRFLERCAFLIGRIRSRRSRRFGLVSSRRRLRIVALRSGRVRHLAGGRWGGLLGLAPFIGSKLIVALAVLRALRGGGLPLRFGVGGLGGECLHCPLEVETRFAVGRQRE